MKHFIVGLTGASCSLYGIQLIEELAKLNHQVSVIFTSNGIKVAAYELKKPILNLKNDEIKKELFSEQVQDNIIIEDNQNIFSACASGTNAADGMIILPCSMGTLAAISQGLSTNLIQRTADVMLKERKQLIVCTREAPYSLIHLKNMVSLTEAGAIIIPCSPGFYLYPETIADIINFMVGKVLDTLGIKHTVCPKWKQKDLGLFANESN